MATYREIQQAVRRTNGFVPKTCWIAHVMADHGLTTKAAANRVDEDRREEPCPSEKRPAILSALQHFKMI